MQSEAIETVDSTPFDATQLARLAIYKAAVQAGFYSDALPAPYVAAATAVRLTEAYPFSALDAQRLSWYRSAIQAGVYSDFPDQTLRVQSTQLTQAAAGKSATARGNKCRP